MVTKTYIRSVVLCVAITVCVSCLHAQSAKPAIVVLNKTDNTLAVIDPSDMKVIGKVPTGNGPHEVVFSEDGRTAFVANYGAQQPGSSISVIDTRAITEMRRVDLGPLARPHGLQMIGGKLYFSAEANRAIARYDPAANKVDWIMGTGQNVSHMVVVSADQKRFFTTNIGSDTVTSFSLNAVPPAASSIAQIAVGKQPEAIDISPDAKEVWVGLNVDKAIDVIDTATNKVTQRINLGARPYRVKFTPDGKLVVNTMLQGKEIIIVDAVTKKEVKRIKLDSTPMGITFAVYGKIAYVTAVEPDAVLKIDLESGKVLASVDSGKAPDGIAIAGM